jgi:hypothetical protein
MKFAAIVRLQNHWWTNHGENLKQSKCNARSTLANNWYTEEIFYTMVDIVKQESEFAIGHTLEIN